MRVPVVDVTNENFREVWPSLVLAVKSATFIALDTELSGLGDRKWLNAKCVEERFKAVSHIAKTRSIVSLGISTFKFLPSSQETSPTSGDNQTESQQHNNPTAEYMVQTFNITVLCQQDYIVEPEALRFLVDHGFDFNKQYSQGIPYEKGDDQKHMNLDEPGIRNVFTQIVVSKVPVVFHNAFIDLGFLYENMYTNLPSSLGTFLSDVSEIFTGGIYDTKYISEFVAHFPASYLDYVFHKSLRENAAIHDGGVSITFPHYPVSQTTVTYRTCTVPDPHRPLPHPEILKAMRGLVCENFASHGWCIKRRECNKSHDIDLILDSEEVPTNKRKRNRKRKRRGGAKPDAEGEGSSENVHHSDEELGKTSMSVNENVDVAESVAPCKITKAEKNLDTNHSNGDSHNDENGKDLSVEVHPDLSPSNRSVQENMDSNQRVDLAESNSQNGYTNCNKGHRAGFDAFMTGFAMAKFASQYGKIPSGGNQTKRPVSEWGLGELVNKVCLSGKSIPLIVTKSSYCKVSKQHTEKLEKLRLITSS